MTTSTPTRLAAFEKIAIDAPPGAVWSKLKDFDALDRWHPAVASSAADRGNNLGSVRQVHIKGGGSVTETLEAWDDAKMAYSYRIAEGGALPVSDYTATIAVSADGKGSLVQWRGSFFSAGAPDDTSVSTISAVYRGGLENLKKLVEGR